jgi:hypothetical protein
MTICDANGVVRRSLVGVTVLLAVLTGCTADEEAATATAGEGPGPDAAAARSVCQDLRNTTNALADVVNDAVAGIVSKPPDERREAIVDGFERALTVVRERAGEVEARVALPDDLAERDQLLAELVAGADAAVVELEDELALFEDEVPTVADDDVAGRVGQLFNAVEKAMSVAEPAVAAYDRAELGEAFLAQPDCRYVVQPYRS